VQLFGHEISKLSLTQIFLKWEGLIANSSALDKVVDWEPVFIDIEGRSFSTWRGIQGRPDGYIIVGHIFVKGTEKPTRIYISLGFVATDGFLSVSESFGKKGVTISVFVCSPI